MERPQLSIAMDSCYKQDGMDGALEDIANIFNIEDNTYVLDSSKNLKDKPPSIIFSFGKLNNKNFGNVYFNIESDHWKSASKKIARAISKQRKKSDSILVFEYNYEGTKAKLTCRTGEPKVVKSAMESLKDIIQLFAKLVENKNVPSSRSMIYCGFDEKSKEYKFDRAVTLAPKFQEYVFDEKKDKWQKMDSETKS